jgi:hypothetical protein
MSDITRIQQLPRLMRPPLELRHSCLYKTLFCLPFHICCCGCAMRHCRRPEPPAPLPASVVSAQGIVGAGWNEHRLFNSSILVPFWFRSGQFRWPIAAPPCKPQSQSTRVVHDETYRTPLLCPALPSPPPNPRNHTHAG